MDMKKKDKARQRRGLGAKKKLRSARGVAKRGA